MFLVKSLLVQEVPVDRDLNLFERVCTWSGGVVLLSSLCNDKT